MSDDDGSRKVTDALVKVLVLSVVLGLAVAGGSYLLITSVGIGDSSRAAKAKENDRPSALPTKALDETGSPSAAESPSADETSEDPDTDKEIDLSANPLTVSPGERINLTGTYSGKDNLELAVQRKEGGRWTSFADLTVSVRVGKFSTYVITSQGGEQRFRVYDPRAEQGSNAVQVTVE